MTQNSAQGGQPVAPLFLTIQETADLLRLTTWSVYRKADEGELTAVYQGRRRYITRESFDRYVAALSTTPEAS